MERKQQGTFKERSREEVLKIADILSLMSRDYYARVNGRVRQVGWMVDAMESDEEGGEKNE